MRIQFLKHLLEAVSALARPNRIVVLGSSSLLPKNANLGEPGQPLELTLDADLLIEAGRSKNRGHAQGSRGAGECVRAEPRLLCGHFAAGDCRNFTPSLGIPSERHACVP